MGCQKENLLVSFSGGRSSAYMMKRLWIDYRHIYNMQFVFANTGQENEKTLIFVDRCSQEWGIPITWVEAFVHMKKRVATTFKIVTFETASRKGEPFEEVIKKYGISNKSYPHCTRELKMAPIHTFIKSTGWTNYWTAIGIRADEPKRVRKDAEAAHMLYPMVGMFPTTKPEIMDFWEDQTFDLGLLEHQGNCTWCWKKSIKKLTRIFNETPEVFEFPARMEEQYGLAGHNVDGAKRTFFRENRSTKDIVTIAQLLDASHGIERPDEDAGCSESCEVF